MSATELSAGAHRGAAPGGATRTSTRTACVTIDLEPDCPPFLWTWRGMETGADRFLDLVAEAGVRATCFTTGDVARRHPRVVRRVVEEGHELACHGMTHRPFPTLDLATARWEIEESARILRDFAPVASFRAPYLQLPREHLPILEETGFRLDSSQARYKLDHYRAATATTLRRVPASITSSALRLPPLVRDRWLDALRSPVVLFVHPWEFVDLTRERLRWDCRVRTGEPALASLRSAIAHLAARAARFVRMDELPPATR